MPEQEEFNRDCTWLSFDMKDDLTVEWFASPKQTGNDAGVEKSDLAIIIIATPRNDVLPALKFLFVTLNNPEFTPVIEIPQVNPQFFDKIFIVRD